MKTEMGVSDVTNEDGDTADRRFWGRDTGTFPDEWQQHLGGEHA